MTSTLKTEANKAAKSTPVTQPDFQANLLGFDMMPQVLDLMIVAQQALPKDEAHFLKPQTLHDLRKHSSLGFPIVGVIEKNSGLVAAVLLLTPASNAEYGRNLEGYPAGLMQSGAAIIQSVTVHPQFKGQGLMKMLLDGAENIVLPQGMTRLVAKVANTNEKSSKGFLSSQFKPAASGDDPKLGYKATFWEKKLDGIATVDIPLFNEPYAQSGHSHNIFTFAPPERR